MNNYLVFPEHRFTLPPISIDLTLIKQVPN